MRWLVVTVVVAAAMASGAAEAATPSFDCARAATWSEKTICGDAGLAALDRELAAIFETRQQAVGDAGRAALVAEQRAWLKTRDTCRADGDPVACLASRYRGRIRDLGSAADPAAAPAPAATPAERRGALGECEREETAAGVGLCLDRKLSVATAAYGDAEAAMLARLTGRPDVATAFRESQTAFIAFRDGTCRWRSALEDADVTNLRQACLVDFTRARTAEIEGLLR